MDKQNEMLDKRKKLFIKYWKGNVAGTIYEMNRNKIFISVKTGYRYYKDSLVKAAIDAKMGVMSKDEFLSKASHMARHTDSPKVLSDLGGFMAKICGWNTPDKVEHSGQLSVVTLFEQIEANRKKAGAI
ncbi:MAG TPA: hypothetical protein DD381_05490 [Lentisphaeria bacterium]|nr:MAG: hypothetical protein A2X47_06970 [Lentisphaerae bacterium GWF2_38_69]HBM15784.1 hypothetical protein [Lentisphaeria bacterium]